MSTNYHNLQCKLHKVFNINFVNRNCDNKHNFKYLTLDIYNTEEYKNWFYFLMSFLYAKVLDEVPTAPHLTRRTETEPKCRLLKNSLTTHHHLPGKLNSKSLIHVWLELLIRSDLSIVRWTILVANGDGVGLLFIFQDYTWFSFDRLSLRMLIKIQFMHSPGFRQKQYDGHIQPSVYTTCSK